MLIKKRFIFIFLSFFCACSQENTTPKGSNLSRPVFDTANAAQTYKQLKHFPATSIDTIYSGIDSVLTEQKKFPLALEHLKYYQKINGETPQVKALTALTNGFYYYAIAKYDSSTLFFDKAADLYLKLNMITRLTDAYSGLVENYMANGDLTRALIYQHKALDIFEHINDSTGMYMVRAHISATLYMKREYAKAIQAGLESLAYFQRRKDSGMVANMQELLSEMFYKSGDYHKSLDYVTASLNYYKSKGDQEGIAQALNGISVVYTALGMWQKAAAIFQESLDLSNKVDPNIPVETTRYNLAVTLRHIGYKDSAMKMFDTLIAEDIRKGDMHGVAKIYRQLSVIYEEDDKDYKQALDYYKRYNIWADSIYTIDKERMFHELNIKYESAKKEEQIVRLSADKRTDSYKKLAYMTAFLFTLIASILTILFLRNRNKKNKLLAEQEIAENKRQLQHFTESILSKNKFIQELELKVNNITEQVIATEESNEHLSELYQFKILTEEDWREFKKLFDKVYPGMISRLREHYPELSPAEERQFLLIKLNIDNNECADMLGISIQSIRKNRYRLKKRFNLNEETNLDDYVKSF